MDLLDRLICDICAATETLMGMDEFDLSAFQPFPKKESSSHGADESGRRKLSIVPDPAVEEGKLGTANMDTGIHRSVC